MVVFGDEYCAELPDVDADYGWECLSSVDWGDFVDYAVGCLSGRSGTYYVCLPVVDCGCEGSEA